MLKLNGGELCVFDINSNREVLRMEMCGWSGVVNLTEDNSCHMTSNVGISDEEFANYSGLFPLYNVGE